MIKCPKCKDGKVFAFVNTGCDYTKHYSEVMVCSTCGGSGEISEEKMRLIEDGQKARRARVARMMTLGDLADELGLKTSTISALESGREVADHVRTMVFEELDIGYAER